MSEDADLDQLVARLEHAAAIIPSAWTTSMLFRECLTALAERDRRIAELEADRDEAVALLGQIARVIGYDKEAPPEMTIAAFAQIKHAKLKDAKKRIAEALEYCEDRQDIIDGEFGPRPNDFMHIATILKGRRA